MTKTEMLKITQIKSTIATPKKVRQVVESLGLRKIGHTKLYKDNNCIRGMINKVPHLVSYEFVKASKT